MKGELNQQAVIRLEATVDEMESDMKSSYYISVPEELLSVQDTLGYGCFKVTLERTKGERR